MQALVRLSILLLAGAFSIASGSSQSNSPSTEAGSVPVSAAPASEPMDPQMAVGLWKSNFGAVKIEADRQGGPAALMGVWLYDRNRQEIIGYFSGRAEGNVLNFTWQEPSDGAPLSGAGYLVFDPQGNSFTGKWWTDNRDRGGDWNGWREQMEAQPGGYSQDAQGYPEDDSQGYPEDDSQGYPEDDYGQGGY